MFVSTLPQEGILRLFKTQILLLLLPLIASIPLPRPDPYPQIIVRSQSLLYPNQHGRQIDLSSLLPSGEVFWLNLEEGYFACQLNSSSKFLKVYHLSRICDGHQDCYRGSDELETELKCSRDCDPNCQNGVCLHSGPDSTSQCHCHDGYGGKTCSQRDVNECKYDPCSIFASCTNTLGSFQCQCKVGYEGDGFNCKAVAHFNPFNVIQDEPVRPDAHVVVEQAVDNDVEKIVLNVKDIVESAENKQNSGVKGEESQSVSSSHTDETILNQVKLATEEANKANRPLFVPKHPNRKKPQNSNIINIKVPHVQSDNPESLGIINMIKDLLEIPLGDDQSNQELSENVYLNEIGLEDYDLPEPLIGRESIDEHLTGGSNSVEGKEPLSAINPPNFNKPHVTVNPEEQSPQILPELSKSEPVSTSSSNGSSTDDNKMQTETILPEEVLDPASGTVDDNANDIQDESNQNSIILNTQTQDEQNIKIVPIYPGVFTPRPDHHTTDQDTGLVSSIATLETTQTTHTSPSTSKPDQHSIDQSKESFSPVGTLVATQTTHASTSPNHHSFDQNIGLINSIGTLATTQTTHASTSASKPDHHSSDQSMESISPIGTLVTTQTTPASANSTMSQKLPTLNQQTSLFSTPAYFSTDDNPAMNTDSKATSSISETDDNSNSDINPKYTSTSSPIATETSSTSAKPAIATMSVAKDVFTSETNLEFGEDNSGGISNPQGNFPPTRPIDTSTARTTNASKNTTVNKGTQETTAATASIITHSKTTMPTSPNEAHDYATTSTSILEVPSYESTSTIPSIIIDFPTHETFNSPVTTGSIINTAPSIRTFPSSMNNDDPFENVINNDAPTIISLLDTTLNTQASNAFQTTSDKTATKTSSESLKEFTGVSPVSGKNEAVTIVIPSQTTPSRLSAITGTTIETDINHKPSSLENPEPNYITSATEKSIGSAKEASTEPIDTTITTLRATPMDAKEVKSTLRTTKTTSTAGGNPVTTASTLLSSATRRTTTNSVRTTFSLIPHESTRKPSNIIVPVESATGVPNTTAAQSIVAINRPPEESASQGTANIQEGTIIPPTMTITGQKTATSQSSIAQETFISTQAIIPDKRTTTSTPAVTQKTATAQSISNAQVTANPQASNTFAPQEISSAHKTSTTSQAITTEAVTIPQRTTTAKVISNASIGSNTQESDATTTEEVTSIQRTSSTPTGSINQETFNIAQATTTPQRITTQASIPQKTMTPHTNLQGTINTQGSNSFTAQDATATSQRTSTTEKTTSTNLEGNITTQAINSPRRTTTTKGIVNTIDKETTYTPGSDIAQRTTTNINQDIFKSPRTTTTQAITSSAHEISDTKETSIDIVTQTTTTTQRSPDTTSSQGVTSGQVTSSISQEFSVSAQKTSSTPETTITQIITTTPKSIPQEVFATNLLTSTGQEATASTTAHRTTTQVTSPPQKTTSEATTLSQWTTVQPAAVPYWATLQTATISKKTTTKAVTTLEETATMNQRPTTTIQTITSIPKETSTTTQTPKPIPQESFVTNLGTGTGQGATTQADPKRTATQATTLAQRITTQTTPPPQRTTTQSTAFSQWTTEHAATPPQGATVQTETTKAATTPQRTDTMNQRTITQITTSIPQKMSSITQTTTSLPQETSTMTKMAAKVTTAPQGTITAQEGNIASSQATTSTPKEAFIAAQSSTTTKVTNKVQEDSSRWGTSVTQRTTAMQGIDSSIEKTTKRTKKPGDAAITLEARENTPSVPTAMPANTFAPSVLQEATTQTQGTTQTTQRTITDRITTTSQPETLLQTNTTTTMTTSSQGFSTEKTAFTQRTEENTTLEAMTNTETKTTTQFFPKTTITITNTVPGSTLQSSSNGVETEKTTDSSRTTGSSEELKPTPETNIQIKPHVPNKVNTGKPSHDFDETTSNTRSDSASTADYPDMHSYSTTHATGVELDNIVPETSTFTTLQKNSPVSITTTGSITRPITITDIISVTMPPKIHQLSPSKPTKETSSMSTHSKKPGPFGSPTTPKSVPTRKPTTTTTGRPLFTTVSRKTSTELTNISTKATTNIAEHTTPTSTTRMKGTGISPAKKDDTDSENETISTSFNGIRTPSSTSSIVESMSISTTESTVDVTTQSDISVETTDFGVSSPSTTSTSTSMLPEANSTLANSMIGEAASESTTVSSHENEPSLREGGVNINILTDDPSFNNLFESCSVDYDTCHSNRDLCEKRFNICVKNLLRERNGTRVSFPLIGEVIEEWPQAEPNTYSLLECIRAHQSCVLPNTKNCMANFQGCALKALKPFNKRPLEQNQKSKPENKSSSFYETGPTKHTDFKFSNSTRASVGIRFSRCIQAYISCGNSNPTSEPCKVGFDECSLSILFDSSLSDLVKDFKDATLTSDLKDKDKELGTDLYECIRDFMMCQMSSERKLCMGDYQACSLAAMDKGKEEMKGMDTPTIPGPGIVATHGNNPSQSVAVPPLRLNVVNGHTYFGSARSEEELELQVSRECSLFYSLPEVHFKSFSGKPARNTADCTWDFFACTNRIGQWPENKPCCEARFDACSTRVMGFNKTPMETSTIAESSQKPPSSAPNSSKRPPLDENGNRIALIDCIWGYMGCARRNNKPDKECKEDFNACSTIAMGMNSPQGSTSTTAKPAGDIDVPEGTDSNLLLNHPEGHESNEFLSCLLRLYQCQENGISSCPDVERCRPENVQELSSGAREESWPGYLGQSFSTSLDISSNNQVDCKLGFYTCGRTRNEAECRNRFRDCSGGQQPDEEICAKVSPNFQNYLVPHPNDCTKFYSCQRLSTNGKRWIAHLMECPEATGFDMELKICNFIKALPRCQTGNGRRLLKAYEEINNINARQIRIKNNPLHVEVAHVGYFKANQTDNSGPISGPSALFVIITVALTKCISYGRTIP